jgi:small basic protein (TIGR04137 family)
MSIDSSLKKAGSLAGHRNVLTRTERIAKLKATKDTDFSKKPVIGLPKVANRASKR